ncbi:MAG: 3-hydroxyacyl-CoA dehydrogenase/enoyl-CoA hydratase family protein, partial [bacterium]|nr:3-hydroxyacyl-CoA dehydrogenase/enoyl-CoA hydratase family protein [bacterium]
MQNPLLLKASREMPKSIAIIGAGTIGPDIGYYLKSAVPGLELVLIDINQDALDRAAKRIEAYVVKGLAKRKLTEEQAAGVREKLVFSMDYNDLAHCDWVLEAATENLD